MKRLNEREISQSYIGKTINQERLLTVSYQNGTSYPEKYPRFISDCYHYKQEFLKLFGITPRLLESWGYRGIEFSVYIYIKDGMIAGSKILKYKNTHCGGHGRPSGDELVPSQQEIRIFRRIMDYITT